VAAAQAFDYTYYNTYTSVVGAFTGWIGIVIFQSFMSGWTFRNLFWVTTLMQVVASAFDLLIIVRFLPAAAHSPTTSSPAACPARY
jgi:hypothetical protein